jgi:hypothetical protein
MNDITIHVIAIVVSVIINFVVFNIWLLSGVCR